VGWIKKIYTMGRCGSMGATEQKTRRSRCKKQKATSNKYTDENCSEGKGRGGFEEATRKRESTWSRHGVIGC